MAAAATVGLAAAGLATPAVLGTGPAAARQSGQPYFTMVSHPDFLNADIGDVSESPYWQPGDPNSINAAYRAGLDTVLDQIRGEHPDAVLVAGDLVEGHWGQDVEDTGIFGPVATDDEKRQAIRNAGALYYRQWLRMFTDRGLRVYPAVGDHDIGDNPWQGSAEADFKRSAMEDYKQTWADVFTTPGGAFSYPDHPPTGDHQATAYAVRLAPEVLLVTVDDFTRTDTDVTRTVEGDQLAWLDDVLTRADAEGIDWVMVQGHVPVLQPVRYRHSSRLRLQGGASSAFWSVLTRHHVDLYLNGEVHDTTAIHRDGTTQISHGGLFYKGESSYLVGRFYDDRLDLEVYDPVSEPVSTSGTLWATSWKRIPDDVRYPGGRTLVGSMTLTSDNRVLSRSGKLAPYTLTTAMTGAAQSRTLTGRGSWTARASREGAEFRFQTATAPGTSSFGPAVTGAWRAGATLRLAVRDGDTTCARARSRVPGTALLSSWSPWRCVTAPRDDAVLRPVSGSLAAGSGSAYFRRTRTRLVEPGTVASAPRVDRSAGAVALRVAVGPHGGRLRVSVGGRRLTTLDLHRPAKALRWFTVRTGTADGRLRLRKVGGGTVWVDALATVHQR